MRRNAGNIVLEYVLVSLFAIALTIGMLAAMNKLMAERLQMMADDYGLSIDLSSLEHFFGDK